MYGRPSGAMWNGIHDMDGVEVIGNMDDDQSMVGPSSGYPWDNLPAGGRGGLRHSCCLLQPVPQHRSGQWPLQTVALCQG